MDREIEIRRLALEERRLEEELQLKKKELDLQLRQFEANQKKKGALAQVFSPVGVGVIAAAIGLLGTGASGLINSYTERKKEEASLILKTSEISDEKQRARNLLFYAQLGYLKFSPKYETLLRGIAGLKEDEQVPPPSTTVNFIPSAQLTPELKMKLDKVLGDFHAYAQKVGFEITSDKIPSVAIRSDHEIATDAQYEGQVAYYEDATKSIGVASDYADDDNVVLRQYAHHILMSANNDFPNEYGYYAIESGLASYFPCSFSKHPMIGDKSKAAIKGKYTPQNLVNNRQFREISLESWDSVQTDGSEIWGGAFWEIHELLGQEMADRLLQSTWARLGAPTSKDKPDVYFVKMLLDTDNSIEAGKNAAKISEIFKRRGLVF